MRVIDNRAVTAYEIYQVDTKIAETPQTFLNLETLSPSTSYPVLEQFEQSSEHKPCKDWS